MKPITQLQFGLQKLAVRLFGGASTRADKQRGASALEYIVLAAAIIVIVGVLAASGVGDTLVTTFQDLFSDASNVEGPG